MNYDATLINYFLQAGIVVKCVMLILILASIFSWTYILQRIFYLRNITQSTQQFEQSFWAGDDLNQLYSQTHRYKTDRQGILSIFHAGYKEFQRLKNDHVANNPLIIDNTSRAMRAAQMREQEKLENYLPFLAIVGSISPYVGLFGTVWGIMQAFRSLADVQQATIAMVAPGIAEALIATALGLFAAIPAVIAYNRFITAIGRLMNRFDAFQEEFINLLVRSRQSQVVEQKE